MILFFFYSCDPKNWSRNYGQKNWNDAKAKCASIGMRLASKEEWEFENKARKKREFWKISYPAFYWTSQENQEGYAFIFDTQYESVHPRLKVKLAMVRCIQ